MPLTIHIRGFRWSATWPMTLLTLAAVVLFVDLGRWQWHRAELKRTQAASFRAGAAALIPADGIALGTLPRYAQVQLHGTYDIAHQFLLDNVTHAGQAGYDVLTPLLLPDGSALIVNRGWIALPGSRAQPPDVAFGASSPTTVDGRLDDLPLPGISLGHVAPMAAAPWPKRTSYPTMSDLSSALTRPLQARELLLNADAPFGYLRDWHPGGMTPARHLAYAVQWWGFAALALFLYLFLNWRKLHR